MSDAAKRLLDNLFERLCSDYPEPDCDDFEKSDAVSAVVEAIIEANKEYADVTGNLVSLLSRIIAVKTPFARDTICLLASQYLVRRGLNKSALRN